MEKPEYLKDFYYSKKGERYLRRMKNFFGENYTETYFKGQPYTECVTTGHKPLMNVDDAIFLGTGTFKDISIKRGR